MRNYEKQILDGEGKDDYARYMRTDALLALQRTPEEVVHRDELLFQIVHQSTELWLKLAVSDLTEATARVPDGDLLPAAELLQRSALAIHVITEHLEMLRHLSPWDFQTIRTILGHGSGADSPGWRSLHKAGHGMARAFAVFAESRGLDVAELYRARRATPELQLVEAMIEWDERVSIWRVRHYKVLTRVLGNQSIGTQGTQVDTLAKLIEYKFFPQLWEVRTELTATGPMGDYHLADS
ncbi:tryptophan 2,3-dioxygenase [Saccharomonospora sp. CUA-673]|uniref:tryptophan 2,3-dioxygenase family protein n=1 Tax=Saccharomonospora sp. CUA-673 TaxID=1904969 RepID=UPI000965CA41|nr:tryptophan 2,3-dioxygenase family protein [Saccharomonospora sp. CUA-673]OLT48749.1 tryptophan 2,3-dioxygenase [Saccharomonospora sp. CUA-673]